MATLERCLTADEYIRRSDLGEFEHTEFIGGEVRPLVSEGWYHSEVQLLLTSALRSALGDKHLVVSSSVRFVEDVPQPDVSVFRRNKGEYRKEVSVLDHSELIHVCEVSRTTGALDRGERLERYAASGISEYWLVSIEDLSNRYVEVYRLNSEGAYGSPIVYLPGQAIALSYEDVTIEVAVILD